MKIYLRDQAANFDEILTTLIDMPVMKFDKSRLTEKTTAIEVAGDFVQGSLDFFYDYKIFPPDIMSFKTQWQLEKRRMRVGDTILQQAYLPPVKIFSQKIIFGVRINNIIDETDRKGFSYETIEGHVESGESTFTIERADGGLIFRIRTFSVPGNLLTRLVAPIVTVPYQGYCTRRALLHVKRQMES